jgi:ABC-type Fe3+-hydroxamate transport system substrate-binding protein
VINPDCGLDRPYMTTPEFVEFAKNADVWVYPGHGDSYWDTAYQDFGDQLDTMKSVQNRQVYDTVLTALNTWYEHRIVEYGKLVISMEVKMECSSCFIFSLIILNSLELNL